MRSLVSAGLRYRPIHNRVESLLVKRMCSRNTKMLKPVGASLFLKNVQCFANKISSIGGLLIIFRGNNQNAARRDAPDEITYLEMLSKGRND